MRASSHRHKESFTRTGLTLLLDNAEQVRSTLKYFIEQNIPSAYARHMLVLLEEQRSYLNLLEYALNPPPVKEGITPDTSVPANDWEARAASKVKAQEEARRAARGARELEEQSIVVPTKGEEDGEASVPNEEERLSTDKQWREELSGDKSS